jgi:hypothetical protein
MRGLMHDHSVFHYRRSIMRASVLKILSAAGLLSLCLVSVVSAAPMLNPVSASTDMGIFPSGSWSPGKTINQVGLSAGYTGGTTDFDTYLASSPTHNMFVGGSNSWISASGTIPGNFDFDLGGSFVIESMALWNIGDNEDINLRGFQLYASSDASFATSTLLGTFNATRISEGRVRAGRRSSPSGQPPPGSYGW